MEEAVDQKIVQGYRRLDQLYSIMNLNNENQFTVLLPGHKENIIKSLNNSGIMQTEISFKKFQEYVTDSNLNEKQFNTIKQKAAELIAELPEQQKLTSQKKSNLLLTPQQSTTPTAETPLTDLINTLKPMFEEAAKEAITIVKINYKIQKATRENKEHREVAQNEVKQRRTDETEDQFNKRKDEYNQSLKLQESETKSPQDQRANSTANINNIMQNITNTIKNTYTEFKEGDKAKLLDERIESIKKALKSGEEIQERSWLSKTVGDFLRHIGIAEGGKDKNAALKIADRMRASLKQQQLAAYSNIKNSKLVQKNQETALNR